MPDKLYDPGCDLIHLNKPRVKHFSEIQWSERYCSRMVLTAQYCNMISIRIMPFKRDGNFRVLH